MAKRKRRTQQQLFTDYLLEYAGGEEIPVSNSSFRDFLEWDEEKYERIKEELIDLGAVLRGQGYGGTVRLPKSAITPPKVFVSYCHADKQLKDELLKHLEPIRRLRLIDTWNDLEILPGEEWDKAISQNLEDAEIVLLLVSIDFINSKYCYDIELQQAITKHRKGECQIVPIILRPCMWKHTPFAEFQALPTEARAVVTWSNQDEALTDIADGLFRIAKDLRNREPNDQDSS